MNLMQTSDAWFELEDGSYDDMINHRLRDLHWDDLDRSAGIQIGDGGMVSETYARAVARIVFFRVIHDEYPEVLKSLVTSDAVEAMANFQRAHKQYMPVLERSMAFWEGLRARSGGVLSEAERTEHRSILGDLQRTIDLMKPEAAVLNPHLDTWMDQWNFQDQWICDSAEMSLNTAAMSREAGMPPPRSLILDQKSLQADPHDGRALEGQVFFESGRSEPIHRLEPIGVMDLLYDIQITTDVIGSFDPRGSDSAAEVTKRLLKELQPRVLRAVERAQERDAAQYGARQTIHRKSLQAFEWLAHYQLVSQSKKKTAETFGQNRSNVLKEINALADLLDLTMPT